MLCSSCGYNNSSSARFCILCGSPLAAEGVKDPDPKVCPSCGELNEGHAMFCTSCGADASTAPRRSAIAQEPEDLPIPEADDQGELPEDLGQEATLPEGPKADEPSAEEIDRILSGAPQVEDFEDGDRLEAPDAAPELDQALTEASSAEAMEEMTPAQEGADASSGPEEVDPRQGSAAGVMDRIKGLLGGLRLPRPSMPNVRSLLPASPTTILIRIAALLALLALGVAIGAGAIFVLR